MYLDVGDMIKNKKYEQYLLVVHVYNEPDPFYQALDIQTGRMLTIGMFEDVETTNWQLVSDK
jgi:hypothetical protein